MKKGMIFRRALAILTVVSICCSAVYASVEVESFRLYGSGGEYAAAAVTGASMDVNYELASTTTLGDKTIQNWEPFEIKDSNGNKIARLACGKIWAESTQLALEKHSTANGTTANIQTVLQKLTAEQRQGKVKAEVDITPYKDGASDDAGTVPVKIGLIEVAGDWIDFLGNADANSYDAPVKGDHYSADSITTLAYEFDGSKITNNTRVCIYIDHSNGTCSRVYIRDIRVYAEKLPTDGYGKVYIAEYDSSGRLLKVSNKAVSQYSTEAAKLDTKESGNTIKAYLLENGTIAPLAESQMTVSEQRKRKVRDVPVSELTDNSDMYDLHFAQYTVPTVDMTAFEGLGTEVIPATCDISYFGSMWHYNNSSWTTRRRSLNGGEYFSVQVTNTGTVENYDNVMMVKRLTSGQFAAGDVCLIKLVFRARNVQNESGFGKISFSIQKISDGGKPVHQIVSADDSWHTVYYPFKAGLASENYYFTIRLPYYLQTVDFKEVSLVNYKDKATVEALPTSLNDLAAVEECTDKDAQWRKEALDRIERIRKGDFRINVVDESGNPVEGADVKAEMTEHEFEWGTAVNLYSVANNTDNPFYYKYRDAIGKYFNSSVGEGFMQWNYFDKDKVTAHKVSDFIRSSGHKNFRGHTLLVDQESSISDKTAAAFAAGNKAEVYRLLEKHIADECLEYYGEVDEWDVINEAAFRTYMRDSYGIELVKNCFDWARKYSPPDTDLYYNEVSTGPKNLALVDAMIAAGVDFDGVGVQFHRAFSTVSGFYNELEELAKRNKKIKITEYDLDMTNSTLQGMNTRDFMIVCFSCEAVEGFYTWGFIDSVHWLNNAPLLDKNSELKYSGQQYVDLVYNKWWTRENKTTGAGGAAAFRGFYGDYKITASYNGKKGIAYTPFYKNGENEVTVVVKPVTYSTVDNLDFQSGYRFTGGGSGYFSRDGKVIGRTASGNTWDGKLGSDCYFALTPAGKKAGVSLEGILPAVNDENRGKVCRIEADILPYQSAKLTDTVDVTVSRAKVATTTGWYVDSGAYGEKTYSVPVGFGNNTWKQLWTTIVYEFEMDDTAAEDTRLIIKCGDDNNTISQFMLDNIKIIIED